MFRLFWVIFRPSRNRSKVIVFNVHFGIPNAFGIPKCTVNIDKLESVSWRAWRWLKRVETCRPKIVFYVTKCCVLTDILYIYEAFVAWSREVVRNVYGGTDKKHAARPVSEPVSSRGSKPASPKYKLKALKLGKASSVSGTAWEQEKKRGQYEEAAEHEAIRED